MNILKKEIERVVRDRDNGIPLDIVIMDYPSRISSVSQEISESSRLKTLEIIKKYGIKF